MAWKKIPKANEELLDRAVGTIPGVEKRKMFGCPVFFLNGNMFAGAHEDNIFLRLSKSDQVELLECPEVSHFTPLPGRMMREYLTVPASVYGDEAAFAGWLEKSRSFAEKLPPKQLKKRKK